MSRYPKAEWVPWQGTNTYYRGTNRPIAVVLHIMEGYQRTARQWAEQGHYGASWHFSVGRDGTVMQHLDFEDGGYHAGITATQAATNPPVWPLWKGPNVNVNTYTIGIEHEGFHNEPWPTAQMIASRELCRWLAKELSIPLDVLHFPPHAVIDTVNRVNDFAPPSERAAIYRYLLEKEDQVTREEYDALVRDIWGSPERREELRTRGVLPIEGRLNNLESNDGPIGKRLSRLETDLTTHRNAPHTGDGILDELGDALIRAGEDLKQ